MIFNKLSFSNLLVVIYITNLHTCIMSSYMWQCEWCKLWSIKRNIKLLMTQLPSTYSHLNKEVRIPCIYNCFFFLMLQCSAISYFGLLKGTLSPIGSNPVGKIASELGTINAQCYYWTTFSNYTQLFSTAQSASNYKTYALFISLWRN